MKELFKSFYYPGQKELKEIWENKNTVFVLDTNILINLYRYKEKTREDFFELLTKIKDRVFLPHHVVLEYQRNRLRAIASHRSHINKFINAIKKPIERDKFFFDTQEYKDAYFDIKQKYPDIQEEFEIALKTLEQTKQELVNVLIDKIDIKKQQFPHVNSDDSIRIKLDNLLLNIGKSFTQDELDKIYKNGEVRYKHNRAPGFKDSDKNQIFYFDDLRFEQKYGDLIIWEQMKSYLSEQKRIVNLIFITDDDSKNDWFESIDSEGKKLIGARTDLQSEIYKIIPRIEYFIMHNSSDFFKLGNDIYNLNLQEQSITDIEDNKNLDLSEVMNPTSYTSDIGLLSFLGIKNNELIKRRYGKNNLQNQLFEIEKEISSLEKKQRTVREHIQNMIMEYKYQQEDPYFDYSSESGRELIKIKKEWDNEKYQDLENLESNIREKLSYFQYIKEQVFRQLNDDDDIPF